MKHLYPIFCCLFLHVQLFTSFLRDPKPQVKLALMFATSLALFFGDFGKILQNSYNTSYNLYNTPGQLLLLYDQLYFIKNYESTVHQKKIIEKNFLLNFSYILYLIEKRDPITNAFWQLPKSLDISMRNILRRQCLTLLQKLYPC